MSIFLYLKRKSNKFANKIAKITYLQVKLMIVLFCLFLNSKFQFDNYFSGRYSNNLTNREERENG